ncbi:MAG: mandelate racemase/muconate lactonizing enzyme family protein [Chloroflexi bacterium]|nr:mandelate racemase/muconate lactonizing enzyme family protein [Chloroflexota bacterium]
MKITDVRAYPLKTRTALVRVFTDEGIEGIGECSPMNVPIMCHFVEQALKPIIVGKDPMDVEQLWNDMFMRTYKLGVMGTQPSCISGVDIALWDIRGKATNMPIYKLLGGAARTRFRMYKSIGGGAPLAAEEMLERVRQAHEEGYTAIKIRMDWGPYRQDADPEKDLRMFQLAREFLPDSTPLSFDANNGYSVSTAIRQGRAFEQLGIYHFEEPVPQYDYEGIKRVADALDVPVSAGEHEYTRWQMRDLLLQGAPDILQPDVVKCCGITEMKRIVTLAETFDRSTLPHQTQPTIGTLASLHVCATSPQSSRPHEFSGERPELNELFEEPVLLEDGFMQIPDRPGLGLVINEERLASLIAE